MYTYVQHLVSCTQSITTNQVTLHPYSTILMWPQCSRQLGGQVENHRMLHHSAQDTGQECTHWIPASTNVHTCMTLYIVQPIIQHTYLHGIEPWQSTYEEWFTQPPMHVMFRYHSLCCMREQEEGVATCRRQGDQSLHLVTRYFNIGTPDAFI